MDKADIILKSTAIFDAVHDEPYKGFLAVSKNKIIAVEKEIQDVRLWADGNTQIVDCGNKLIMPGMIDAHMHFFNGIFQNSQYMCRDLFDCKSAKECVEVIGKFAKKHPEYEKITGMGWFIPIWEDKTPPCKQMLDAVEPDRPVYLMCADGHSFWLNSKALEVCKIRPERKLCFGSIEVDETGAPNGLLHEMDACSEAAAKAQELPSKQRRQMILDFISQLSQKGITAVTDMAINPEPVPITEELKTVEALEKEGNLNIRLSLYPSLGMDENFNIAKQYRKRFHSEKLNVGGLKAFVDGVHSNHTALLLEPYADAPETTGSSFFPYAFYEKQITAANKAGFGVKLHCAGEGAVKMALDAYETSLSINKDADIRNSMEHVETAQYQEFERMGDLNVTAAMQPSHLMFTGDSLKRKLGETRVQYEYALATMEKHKVNIAFSSDYPVAPFDPMLNIYFAVTRCDIDGDAIEENSKEKITLAEALKAYTYGSAYCLHTEHKTGTLESGKLADIVVFDQNLFDMEDEELLSAQIYLTMSDGKIVYQKEDLVERIKL